MKFDLGRILITPGALTAINAGGRTPKEFFNRHATGDWGDDLCDEDRCRNEEAIADGSRLLSSYKLPGNLNLWLITEAAGDDGHRAATTALLSHEY